eukprot:TRINITY_DN50615_c0_g2_i1.p1 TRINITY_DN50615_c0_g2~~TRINITY_DN50615_c0_g2_i1.p1  ORF type:complete len:161 (-),score=29.90 TRINITY_DN50615_c0_g2_i1:22-504(-)
MLRSLVGSEMCIRDRYDCGAVTNELRNQFLTWHQIVMDGTMVVFAPTVAFVTLLIGRKYGNDSSDSDNGPNVDTFAMLLALGGFFFIFFTASVICYAKNMPAGATEKSSGPHPRDSNLADAESLRDPLTGADAPQLHPEPESCCQTLKQTCIQGLSLIHI